MTKRKSIILFSVITAMIIVGTYLILGSKSTKDSYRSYTVKKDELVLSVQSTGLVSPQNRLEIKPPVAGRIEEVLVNEGDKVKKGKTLAWISSNERAALLDSVRAQGEKEIKKWEQLYRPTPVIAPIQGTIILRNVESGQSFLSTDAIFVMADRLTIKAQVDETDISQIKLNQEAVITLDAYPQNQLKGKVVHVAYDATVLNNVTTYEVDILPDSVPEFMRSGMTSNVNIQVNKVKDALIIPLDAIITDAQGTFVLIPNGEKITSVPVKLGLDDGRRVEIVQGLNEGDVVLIKEAAKKSKKSGSSNPLLPSGRRGGGKR